MKKKKEENYTEEFKVDRNSENIIEIENLSFKYDTSEEEESLVKALDDVSFSIKRGSFTAIIGKNGSGKSTAAKCINGLLVPNEGTVLVNGMSTLEEDMIWEIRKTAGMVFQNPDNQIVSSIVEDDVAFGPENLGIDPLEIRERVDNALETVKMGQYKRKGPHQLSGGQKQRIAIAGAVAMEPECIIFDEPTAMLDPQGRQEVMNIVHQLNQKGITVVLITHMMEEAVLADKIIIMDEGKLVLEGVPKEVFSKRELLTDLSLGLPFEIELAYRIKEMGKDIDVDLLEEKELIEQLKALKVERDS